MAVSSKKKATRKVVMVRIVCLVMVVLLVIPLVLSTLLTGVPW